MGKEIENTTIYILQMHWVKSTLMPFCMSRKLHHYFTLCDYACVCNESPVPKHSITAYVYSTSLRLLSVNDWHYSRRLLTGLHLHGIHCLTHCWHPFVAVCTTSHMLYKCPVVSVSWYVDWSVIGDEVSSSHYARSSAWRSRIQLLAIKSSTYYTWLKV